MIKNLDESISHCEEVAKEQDKLCKRYDDASGYSRSHNEAIRTTDAKRCEECASEHRQLAVWLRELKARRRIDKLDHIILMTAQYQMPEDLEQMRNEIKELEKFVEEANADV